MRRHIYFGVFFQTFVNQSRPASRSSNHQEIWQFPPAHRPTLETIHRSPAACPPDHQDKWFDSPPDGELSQSAEDNNNSDTALGFQVLGGICESCGSATSVRHSISRKSIESWYCP